ncbi:hypothetical protein [Yinghuangia seranimata]|uniref:hypothetical protein n=1 Tax=Yinghuangia seranimata TaxID=408067 RepID=UPI00248C65AD|nr:hypothetical protein [Yinghuangia seranimata]MDI2131277.1 hypothetical protein [Yinghuangia seranimata]
MNRRRMLNALKSPDEFGQYADEAVLPEDTDPQVYLSHNRLPQPFHLLCEKDSVISQLSGTVDVYLHDSSVNRFRVTVGDHVYIPAGTPHRIVPREPGVTLRYMALEAGLLGAAWYCASCGGELRRYEWEHDNAVAPARFYAAACARFNADKAARTCESCATVHEEIDLDAYAWTELAAAEG